MSAMSLRDAGGDGGVDAVGLVAHQRFARQLQQDAAVGTGAGRRGHDWDYACVGEDDVSSVVAH